MKFVVLSFGSSERTAVRGYLRAAVTLAVFLCVSSGCGFAQAMAEYGHLSAGTAAAKPGPLIPPPALPPPARGGSSRHMTATTGEPADVLNRKAIEQSAGENAAIITLRSEPQGADVWLDDKIVGRSPLTIKIAPGNHVVEMEGAQTEVVKQKIVVVATEKRELVLQLKPRYRTQIRLQ